MCEIGGRLDLLDEPLSAQHGCQLGPQHLHGHLAVVFQVLGEIDRCHPAGADFALEGVTVREGDHETILLIRHGLPM